MRHTWWGLQQLRPAVACFGPGNLGAGFDGWGWENYFNLRQLRLLLTKRVTIAAPYTPKTDRVEQFGGNKIVMIMSTSNTDYLKFSCNITSGRESKSQVQNVWTVVVQLIWLISQVFDGVSCGFVRHIHRHDYCSWVVHELWGHNGKSIGCGCIVCVWTYIHIYNILYTIYPKRAYLSTRKRRCVQPSGAPFLNNPSLCDSAV